MPAITIDNLSPKALAAWERRAAIQNRTVEEVVKDMLEELAADEPERLPMYVSSPEISAPFDLPYESTGVKVKAKEGGKRWPDPATLPSDGETG